MAYENGIDHGDFVHPTAIDVSSSRSVVYMEPGCFELECNRRKRLQKHFGYLLFLSSETERLKEYTESTRIHNETHRLSFYDDRGNRYINSIYDYYSDYEEYFKAFLNKVKKAYQDAKNQIRENKKSAGSSMYYDENIVVSRCVGESVRASKHDFVILDRIFNTKESLEILRANNYNFFRPSKKYRSETEKCYCDAVTEALTEMMIKVFNYIRYYDIRHYGHEEEHNEWILEEIRKHYTDHVNDANGSKRGNKIKKSVLSTYF